MVMEMWGQTLDFLPAALGSHRRFGKHDPGRNSFD
jgi:hypothetical protein